MASWGLCTPSLLGSPGNGNVPKGTVPPSHSPYTHAGPGYLQGCFWKSLEPRASMSSPSSQAAPWKAMFTVWASLHLPRGQAGAGISAETEGPELPLCCLGQQGGALPQLASPPVEEKPDGPSSWQLFPPDRESQLGLRWPRWLWPRGRDLSAGATPAATVQALGQAIAPLSHRCPPLQPGPALETQQASAPCTLHLPCPTALTVPGMGDLRGPERHPS